MTKLRVVRNWQAICQEPNSYLKWLVDFTNEERVLEPLRQAFPQFFTPMPPTWRVPLYFVRQLSELHFGFGDMAEYRAMWTWLPAVSRLRLPIAHRWHRKGQIPNELATLLNDSSSRLYCGDRLEYAGHTYLVVDHRYKRIVLHEETIGSHLTHLSLVSCEYIDETQDSEPLG